MAIYFESDKTSRRTIRAFVESERRKCLSDREWRHRLVGYGYDVRQEAGHLTVVTLPQQVAICDLPLERPGV